jgi:hypothetical protein
LTNIAGYTARVSELLEMIEKLQVEGEKPFEIVPDPPSHIQPLQGIDQWLLQWKERCDKRKTKKDTKGK